MGGRLSLLIALVVGGIAAFLVREVVQTVALTGGRGGPVGTIVVARAAIPFGAPLTADNLQEVAWQSADPLQGSFATVGDLVKDGRRLALLSVQRNEPILASRITAPNGRATLSAQLDEGMRAVTVRVDEVRGVAGFILPGDRVDVILTRNEEGGQDAAASADVLLQNAKVLAIDQVADERQDKPTVARAVTLELAVQEAQKVVLAQGIGRLSLALRQANGGGEDASARVTASDLGGVAQVSRDRLAELDKRVEELKAAAEAARTQADRDTARKLAELETRMRGQLAQPAAPTNFALAAPPKPVGSVITVTRNGSKTESYTVSAER